MLRRSAKMVTAMAAMTTISRWAKFLGVSGLGLALSFI
jgi:hypothetical protein